MQKITLMMLFAASSYTYALCDSNIARTAPDSRYELLNSNSEVKDTQTKLIWQRCSLGQAWDGTSCKGSAATYNWTNALQTAKNIGSGWRLPNVKELNSLVEQACYEPAINETYFPNTDSSIYSSYWSSSPVARASDTAWIVNFKSGINDYFGTKNNSRYVRLVRSSQ